MSLDLNLQLTKHILQKLFPHVHASPHFPRFHHPVFIPYLHIAPLQCHHLSLRGFIVDPQQTILPSGGELAAIVEVV